MKIEGKEKDVSYLIYHHCLGRFIVLFFLQVNDEKQWVVGRSTEEATERARKIANGAAFTLEQDEDVLDTWFSSGLWPFSILGWPENVRDICLFSVDFFLKKIKNYFRQMI